MLKSLLFLPFILLTYSAFCQEPFQWPKDLKINPNEYALKQLGIKKISQTKKYGNSHKFADTSLNNLEYLDYVITYDSNQRISTFKYDFLNHLPYSEYFGDSSKLDSLSRILKGGKLPICFIKLNNEWVAKNYREALFSYDIYGLNKIEIIRPYLRLGTRGVLDGVYFEKTKQLEIKTIFHYNEFDEIIQLESYSENKLIHQESYEYKTYENNNKIVRLLHLVVDDDVSYSINYYFDD